MKKKIVYITGSRADFGRAYYILKAIQNNNFFELNIIATSMHLSLEFGYTVQEIERKFQIKDKIDTLLAGDSPGAMAKSLGIGIIGITQALERIKPDMIIVLGDRGEMLAGATAGSHLNMPVAHVGGGCISGSIDDKIRDAITIFSNIHFVANEKCKGRVISLGANPLKTYVVGAPDIEAIRKKDFPKAQEVALKFNIDLNKPLILVSYHPVTDEYEDIDSQIREVFESILEFKIQTIITYPNADAGGRRIIKVIEKYSKYPFIYIYKHISYKWYLGLMNVASVMVGNSSAGIFEAPSFGLPVVNIGTRQRSRERAENVIDVGYSEEEIKSAIKKALYDEDFREKAKNCINPYGDGQTSGRIVRILEEVLRDE